MSLVNWVHVFRTYLPFLWYIVIGVLLIQIFILLYTHRFDLKVIGHCILLSHWNCLKPISMNIVSICRRNCSIWVQQAACSRFRLENNVCGSIADLVYNSQRAASLLAGFLLLWASRRLEGLPGSADANYAVARLLHRRIAGVLESNAAAERCGPFHSLAAWHCAMSGRQEGRHLHWSRSKRKRGRE